MSSSEVGEGDEEEMIRILWENTQNTSTSGMGSEHTTREMEQG